VPQRRFPPPWSAEETDACFIVRDANGHALAYVYFDVTGDGVLSVPPVSCATVLVNRLHERLRRPDGS
jgi:hypothetical protein